MSTEVDQFELERETVQAIHAAAERIGAELSKVIVGQKDVIEQMLVALFAGGHCLLTGAPRCSEASAG